MFEMRSNNSAIHTKSKSNESNQNFNELQLTDYKIKKFKKNQDLNLNDLSGKKNTENESSFTNLEDYGLNANNKSLFFKKLTIFAVNVFLNLLMISTIVGLLIYFLGITGM